MVQQNKQLKKVLISSHFPIICFSKDTYFLLPDSDFIIHQQKSIFVKKDIVVGFDFLSDTHSNDNLISSKDSFTSKFEMRGLKANAFQNILHVFKRM